MSSGVIELLVLLAFVIPICWWQFRDLEKAKQETARKREEAARKKALEAAQTAPAPEASSVPDAQASEQK